MFYKRILLFIILISSILFLGACSSSKKASKAAQKDQKMKEEILVNKYAKIMKTDSKNLTNKKLLSFIDEWYGVPYKYAGRSKNGVDCSNFISLLFESVYDRKITGTTSTLAEDVRKISPRKLKEGDLVFFNIADKKKVSHVGVIIYDKYFVHATTKKGVMINHLDENYYKNYFSKAGRLKN